MTTPHHQSNGRPAQSNPRVRIGPAARAALRDGMTVLADAVGPTLGPHGRLVAVQRDTGNTKTAPDLLQDGSAIARRLYGLPDRWQSMGLLLARHAAARVNESVGSGGSTTIVMAQAMVDAGLRLIAAGHDPMPLRQGLETASRTALTAIEHSARPLDTDQHVAALARAIIGHDGLAALVGECLDIVGPDGVVDIRSSQSTLHEREFVQGVMWNEGWKSSHFVTDGGAAILRQPYLLLCTHRLTTASQLAPVMGRLIEANEKHSTRNGLVVIAFAIEGDALNLLIVNKARGVLPALAIHAPGVGNDRFEILNDLAVLSGGKLFAEEAGDRVEDARIEQLGEADEVQAIRSACTIIGGKGRPAAVRGRIVDLRKQATCSHDSFVRDQLHERAGKLLGGAALLHVGGASTAEREHLKARAEQAVRVIRLGVEGGVVAGGGAAYLAGLPALASLRLPDERSPAVAVLREGLLAPMRALIRNSGVEPEPIIHEVLARNAASDDQTYGFDVQRGCVADMLAANIIDPLKVVTTALATAVSCAGMTLTTEALVHKPRSIRDDDVKLDP